MTKKSLFRSGFTLIELIVATIIIAVLLAVSVPMYLVQAERAMGAKAKENLQNIFNAQMIYMAENETFTANRAELNSYAPIGPDDADWAYDIGATQTTFTATALRTSPNPLYNGRTISINNDSVINHPAYP